MRQFDQAPLARARGAGAEGKCPYGHPVDISFVKWTFQKNPYNTCRIPMDLAQNPVKSFGVVYGAVS